MTLYRGLCKGTTPPDPCTAPCPGCRTCEDFLADLLIGRRVFWPEGGIPGMPGGGGGQNLAEGVDWGYEPSGSCGGAAVGRYRIYSGFSYSHAVVPGVSFCAVTVDAENQGSYCLEDLDLAGLSVVESGGTLTWSAASDIVLPELAGSTYEPGVLACLRLDAIGTVLLEGSRLYMVKAGLIFTAFGVPASTVVSGALESFRCYPDVILGG